MKLVYFRVYIFCVPELISQLMHWKIMCLKNLTHSCTFRNLRHPNILHFLGYAKDDKQLAILTNLVDGDDLYKMLFEKKIQVMYNSAQMDCYF